MSKSNPPQSNTVDLLKPASNHQVMRPSPEDLRRVASRGNHHVTIKPKRHPFYTWFAGTVRWLHIYVSLLGFTALIFFAATGITLNHPTWLGGDFQKITEIEGSMNAVWLEQAVPTRQTTNDSPSNDGTHKSEEASNSLGIDRLSVVEHIRNHHQIRGAVSEFQADERECMILFKGPAYAADFYVDRENGQYRGTLTTMGIVAVMNDLHKGRDSGKAWSWVIDISGVVTIIVSVTGIILLFYLKKKKNSGVLTAVAGTLLLAIVYYFWVP